LQEFVHRCVSDVAAADALGRAAKKVVQSHRGATARTLQAIENLVGQPAVQSREAA
jgi:3-deoxy-D-manno-octulosonic-acid transferase